MTRRELYAWSLVGMLWLGIALGYILRGTHIWDAEKYAEQKIYRKFHRSAEEGHTFLFDGRTCIPRADKSVTICKEGK